MENEARPWDEIDALALRYYYLEQMNNSSSLKDRSQEQIDTINEIIIKIKPFLQFTIYKLCTSGEYLSVGKEKIHLRGLRVGADYHVNQDLINEAIINLIENISNYDPSKGQSYAFIKNRVISFTYRYLIENCGLIRIPHSVYDATKYNLYKGREDFVDFCLNEGLFDGDSTTASLVYSIFNQEFLHMDDICKDTEEFENNYNDNVIRSLEESV